MQDNVKQESATGSCTENDVSCGVVLRLLWESRLLRLPVRLSDSAHWARGVKGEHSPLPWGRIAELLAAFSLLRVFPKRKTSSWHGKWLRDNHTNSPLTGRVGGMGYIFL